MRCPFCDREFDEESAESGCRNCSLFGGCRKVKCPHCGYKSPAEAGLIKWLKKRLTRTS